MVVLFYFFLFFSGGKLKKTDKKNTNISGGQVELGSEITACVLY